MFSTKHKLQNHKRKVKSKHHPTPDSSSHDSYYEVTRIMPSESRNHCASMKSSSRLSTNISVQYRNSHSLSSAKMSPSPSSLKASFLSSSSSASSLSLTASSTMTTRRMMTIVVLTILISSSLVTACGPGRRSAARRHPRKLTPLVFKQHVPNVSENTLGASGLNEGRVTREHKRFRELVPNYNADIVFRDEEGTGADRLMTQRLKEKLNTLAISVMNQWPGVRLRVLDSWTESEGPPRESHAPDSLHYEGRAVDITTSDRDRSKYGMLARLAVEAGFDWVYYESRFHIHCSVKSEKSSDARNGGCFDGNSVVNGRNGPITMKDLKIGDEIESINSDGKPVYSPILMFLDHDRDIKELYYIIETHSGRQLTATPQHLIFVSDRVTVSEIMNRADFVKNAVVGQYLLTVHNSTVRPDRIVKISTVTLSGAYAPLTATGNLIVNNVTVSCYAVVQSQTLAHLSFLPVRLAHHFVELGDWLSTHLRSTPVVRSSSQSVDSGVHWYASMLYKRFRFLVPTKLVYN